MDNCELLNACPLDEVRAKQAAKGEAVGCEMKVSSFGVELDAEDRQTKREEPAAEVAHCLAVANHESTARNKYRADEKQESRLQSAWT
jgi:hypothetical protein